MSSSLLYDIAKERVANLLREAEKARQVRRAKKPDSLPAILKSLWALLFSLA